MISGYHKANRQEKSEMTKENQIQQNKMGTQKMLPLIFNMTWPPFCSMMMAYSYNLIDSMFVAWAGKDELAAVSLAFPPVSYTHLDVYKRQEKRSPFGLLF